MEVARTFRITVIAPLAVMTDTAHPGRLAWRAVPGHNYRVEYTEDLATAEWRLLDEFTATLPDVVIEDPAAGQANQRFYRVIWQW